MTTTREINDLINRMRDTDLSTRRHALAHELRHAVAALSTPATEPQGYVEGLEAALGKIARWFGEFPATGRFWDDKLGQPKKDEMSYAACFGSNGERDFMRGVANAALAARPAPQPAADTRVVVKPLVWRQTLDGRRGSFLRRKWDALSDFGVTYEIWDYDHVLFDTGLPAPWHNPPPDDAVRYCLNMDGRSRILQQYHPTLELAQAAAQADYETRILSAIIGTATPAPSDKIAEALAKQTSGGERQRYSGFGHMLSEASWHVHLAGFRSRDEAEAAMRALAGQGE